MVYRRMPRQRLIEGAISMPFQFLHSTPLATPALLVPALGLSLKVMLAPSSSGGELTVFETVNAPGFGPPLHRHTETEVFRVLEGRYVYEVNGQYYTATEGDVMSVPGGVPHRFVNVGDRPARQLVMMLPGLDAAAFFNGLAEVLRNGPVPREVLNAFGEPWRCEFLGGPLTAEAALAKLAV
jgi:quercetin dioxygenase-like cupin family protein